MSPAFECRHELEDACSELGVAGDQRALHGSSTSPLGQKREVEVDPPLRRGGEQRLSHEAAIRDDHAELDLQGSDRLCRLVTEPRSLDDRQTEVGGCLSDG